MQRTMQTVLIALVIAIGLTAGSLAWRVASAPQIAPDIETTDPAIGYAFYQALDEVLASGDGSALDGVVSGGFIDHVGEQEQSTGDLVDALMSFGASFPDLQVRVLDMQSASGTLVASIAPVQLTGPMLEGMRISTEPIAGGFEVLRIRNGKVTDRWASGLPDVRLASFADAGLQVGGTFSNTVRLEEIEIPADGSFTWRAFGERVVIVKTGTVAARFPVDRFPGRGHARIENHRRRAGCIEPIGNDGNGAGRIRHSGEGTRAAPDPAKGHAHGHDHAGSWAGHDLELLWQSNLPTIPEGTWNLSFARLTLPPGITAALTSDAPSTLLLSAEGDASRIAIDDGELSKLDHTYAPASEGMQTSLDAGTAAFVEEANAVEIASAGSQPATVWLIRIRLDDPRATPGAR